MNTVPPKHIKRGGLCIKDGSLYQCTADIDTAEVWTASHWKRISLSDAFNSLNKDLIETKKSVSEGKSAIASALTEMGVSTESDATFETIVNNINSISNKKTVVNLGRSSTYSVTSYPGYQNFTVANNFLVGTYSASASSRWDDDSGNWSRSCSSSTNQTVSYNASTGVLTVKINRSNGSKSDHVGEISGSISGNQPNVWLVY